MYIIHIYFFKYTYNYIYDLRQGLNEIYSTQLFRIYICRIYKSENIVGICYRNFSDVTVSPTLENFVPKFIRKELLTKEVIVFSVL